MALREEVLNLIQSYKQGLISQAGYKKQLEDTLNAFAPGQISPGLSQGLYGLGDAYRMGGGGIPGGFDSRYNELISEAEALRPAPAPQTQPIPQQAPAPQAPAPAPAFFAPPTPAPAPVQAESIFAPQAQTQAAEPSVFASPALENLVPGSRFPTIPFQQEVPAFEGMAQAERGDINQARGQFLNESLATQPLFLQAGEQEEADLEAARARAMQEAETALQNASTQARSVFAPEFEKTLKRNAGSLGARQGLGAGGFEGSGAYQELAARNARELENQVMQAALPNFFNAQQNYSNLGVQARTARSPFRSAALENRLGAQNAFANFGLEANLTPATYRRSLFERGLGENDRLADIGSQYEFADKAQGSAIDAARANRRGVRDASIISGFGGLAGGFLRNPSIFGGRRA